VSIHDYQAWREQQTVFDGLGAFYTGTINLSGSERPERYFGAFVTANTFSVLGVDPVMGRAFRPGEDAPGAPLVAVISHSVWRDRYQGDAGLVGELIRVNGEPATLIGIMPEGFSFPYWQDVWVPMRVNALELERGGGPGLEGFGKLREGVTPQQAVAEFQGISARLAAAYPLTNEGLQAFLEPYADSYRDDNSAFFAVIMMGTAFSVLLLACFNVTNLLLARAVTRTRDMAIRTAVGASRRQVVVGLLQEALLLAGGGALLGIALAVVGTNFIDGWITAAATFPLPFWIEFSVETPVLVFAVTAGVVSALASGLLPAMRASKTDVHGLLKSEARSMSSLRIGRLSRGMVLAELTVSALLLVVGGHFVREISAARHSSYGFQTENVLTARVGLFEGVFPGLEERQAFYLDLRRNLLATPGVEAAALGTTLPGQVAGRIRLDAEGVVHGQERERPTARYAAISTGYFETVGVIPERGRVFAASDDVSSGPVAVVNRSFAERLFPDADPLGRRVRIGEGAGPEDWRTIVGVVPDLHMDGAFDPEGMPEGVYVPLTQSDARFVSIAARTLGDPMALAPTLREEVATLQGDTPVYFVMSLQDSINIGLLDFMLIGGLFGVLGLAAFILGSVGLYGVMAFLARQRTREVGLRMAMGARAGDVLRMIARQGTAQVIGGVTAGVVLAALFRAAFIAMGQDATPWQWSVTLLVCGALIITGMTATLIPAHRATTVDPMEALREE
jgi:predicted permease